MPVAAVTITWADGTVTTVCPPETPARPVNATPAHWPRGLPDGIVNYTAHELRHVCASLLISSGATDAEDGEGHQAA